MKSFSINKNRFRNFCLGMSVACMFVLWAFNIEQVKTESVIEIIYDSGEPYVQISSFFEEEVVEKKKTQKKLETKPLQENQEVKIVDDFSALKNLNFDFNFNFDLNRKSTPPPAPTPVLPNGIELRPDVLPRFPGGNEALLKFLETNLRYPEECIEIDRSGVVVVKFVVDEEGKISEAIVVKDEMGCMAAHAALVVMNKMPRWQPALKNGQPVKTYFTQVFRFRMF